MRHRLDVLHIETTTACNLRCAHCTRVLPDYEVKSMPWEIFERLIPAMREYCPLVFLNGHGEPLVHSDFRKQFAAAADSGCRIRFQTNGQLLSGDLTAWLMKTGAWDRLDVSIDGATRETYEGIRQGASFSTLEMNLDDFCLHRGQKEKPSLHVEFVAMTKNISELPAVISFAARYGVESVLVTELIETPACRGWSAIRDRGRFADYLADASELAHSLNIRLQMPRIEAAIAGQATTWRPCGAEGTVCRTPWMVAYILPDGRVQPCCRLPLSMGSIVDGGLENVLRGEAWRNLLEQIEAGNPPEDCRSCPWL